MLACSKGLVIRAPQYCFTGIPGVYVILSVLVLVLKKEGDRFFSRRPKKGIVGFMASLDKFELCALP